MFSINYQTGSLTEVSYYETWIYESYESYANRCGIELSKTIKYISVTQYIENSQKKIQGEGYTYLAKSASEPVSARMMPAK